MTDPDALVRATQAHAEAMAVIHRACFPPAAAWDADAFTVQLGMPGGFGLIDPAGGFILARLAADEAEILTLAVVPASRGMGMGRRLLDAAIRMAADLGAAAIFLEVAANNDAALSLYAAAKFAHVGVRRGYYPDGVDAFLMRLDLVTPCGS